MVHFRGKGATAAFPRFGTGNGPIAKAPSSARGSFSSLKTPFPAQCRWSAGLRHRGDSSANTTWIQEKTNNPLSFSWFPTLVPGFLEALGFGSRVRFQPFCNKLSLCPGGQTSSGIFSKSLLSSPHISPPRCPLSCPIAGCGPGRGQAGGFGGQRGSWGVSGFVWPVWKGSVAIWHPQAPQEHDAQLRGIPADPSLPLCFASPLLLFKATQRQEYT